MTVPQGNLRDRSIIAQMVARRTYLGDSWPFGEMTPARLCDLSVAADRLAEPYYRLRELARGWDPAVLKRVEDRLGPVDEAPDADAIEWAQALRDELETRRTGVAADTTAEVEAALSRVRRLIDLARPEAR